MLMENEVLRSLRQLIGWTEGDGIFCPGGSTSNMYAMNLARFQLFPEVKSQGLCGLPRLAVFTSSRVKSLFSYVAHVGMFKWGFLSNYDGVMTGMVFSQSHYSVKKGATLLGIGTDNVIMVKVNDG